MITQMRGEVKRRLFDESIPRIKKCLHLLTPQQLWQRPNDSLVSVGNLTLHCIGNARQWIGSAMGGLPDERQRALEFSAREGPDATELSRLLDVLQRDLEPVIDAIQTNDLEKSFTIQGLKETGLSVLIHVVEHFSYHTGQISWFTKFLLDTDLDYYDEKNLNDTLSG
jgi:uncharacterized damage-inducible protein DinB